jgi:dTDP-4-dehydrorhamnose reductase
VFDGTKTGAYQEDDAPAPVSVYGASKLAGERAVAAALAQHVILRTSWVYSAIGQNFVKTMLRLARERDELRVVDDQRGRPTSAAELAGAVLGVATAIRAGRERVPWGLYHFAGATSLSWCGFAKAIVEEQVQFSGRRPTVTPISTAEYPTPAKRPANSVLATERFEAAFGVKPRASHDELRQVVRELNPA